MTSLTCCADCLGRWLGTVAAGVFVLAVQVVFA